MLSEEKLTKFAKEQNSSDKRKFQPGSGLDTKGQSRSCSFKKSQKTSKSDKDN